MKKLFVLIKGFYAKILLINYSDELRVFMNELYTTSEAAQDLQISQKSKSLNTADHTAAREWAQLVQIVTTLWICSFA